MNRYAQVLTASALAYTAQAGAAAKWARGTTMSSPPQFIATAEQGCRWPAIEFEQRGNFLRSHRSAAAMITLQYAVCA
jgi:hypothetical protein